jgi:hypothetical protein
MISSGEIELLQADVRDCHDRVALLRAKLYRWGFASNAQIQKLERELERAEERLRDAAAQHPRAKSAGPHNVPWR